MTASLPVKLVSEVITVDFNFLGEMEWEESLLSAEVTVEVFSGIVFSPELILLGSATVNSPEVLQVIQFGTPGVIYLLIATAIGSSGNTYVKTRKLAVVSDDSAFKPPFIVQMTGTLTDGTSRVPYEDSLTIFGGFPPYEFDDIVAGTAPGWMAFNVVNSALVCSGTPAELPTTNYIFTPQIRDAVNNLASAPQDITFVHLVISGSIPGGRIGDAVAGAYTQVNGYGTVTYAVTSGTFPDGLTLNADGTYSGTFSSGGHFTWEVTGTDSAGNTSTISNSCDVLSLIWWLVTGDATSTTDRARLWTSLDPMDWTAPVSSRIPNVNPVYGPVGIPDAMLVWSNSSTYEYITNLSTLPAPTTIKTVSTLTLVRFVRVFDDLIFTSDQSGPYWLSVDNALTWTKYPSPNGNPLDTLDLAQLNSGRWITITYGGPRRGFYSDLNIPTSWQSSGSISSGECLVSSGTACIVWGTSTFSRTTSGTSWSNVVVAFTPSNYCGAYGLGTFVCSGPSGNVARSTNDGLTWTLVALPVGGSCTSIQFINGLFLVTVAGGLQGGYLFISDDAGLTWQTPTLPYNRTLASQGNCRIGATYGLV